MDGRRARPCRDASCAEAHQTTLAAQKSGAKRTGENMLAMPIGIFNIAGQAHVVRPAPC
jgi:hypothetical protein